MKGREGLMPPLKGRGETTISEGGRGQEVAASMKGREGLMPPLKGRGEATIRKGGKGQEGLQA
jgi:hypothetical protein